MSQDPLIGQTLAEYRVDGVLGRGGMGVVYAAEDTALGIPVALKTIDRGLANDDAFVRRFRSEARAMARASSPHIVRVMALRETPEAVFIVMEKVDGGTVWDLIHAPRRGHAGIPWAQAWPLVQQMLSALQAAHAVGVVHRDIKPRNVMIDGAGTVKVTDFGLAKVYADVGDLTVTQAVAGTLLYMSPEQVRGEKRLDGRSDLFSLALTIYEMLAGRLPFDRDAGEFAVMKAIVAADFQPPSAWGADVPPDIEAVLMRALAADKDARPASADALCDALIEATPPELETRTLRPLAALRGTTSDATQTVVSAADRTQTVVPVAPPTRRPLLLAAAAAFVAALAVVGFLLWPPAEPTPVEPVTVEEPELAPVGADSLVATVVPGVMVPEGQATLVQPTPQPQRQVVQQAPPPQPQQVVVQQRPPPQQVTPPPAAAPSFVSVVPKAGLAYTVNGSPASGPVQLGAGRHTVACTAGGLTATQTVRVSSGQTVTSECHATPLAVNVVATTDGPPAWAQVALDGAPAGQTPTRLTVPPGRHTVTVQRDGYEVITGAQTVDNPPRFAPAAPGPARLVFEMRATGG